MARPKSTGTKDSTANLGFEAKLWLAPYKGHICDPACGSRVMFVQSEMFVMFQGGMLDDTSIYGQKCNATTRRFAIMNLVIRGIEADISKEHADTVRNVQHPDLRATFQNRFCQATYASLAA